METVKPRLFMDSNGLWQCAAWQYTHPLTRGRLYMPIGNGGATPKEAWDSAFPPTRVQRIASFIREVCAKARRA